MVKVSPRLLPCPVQPSPGSRVSQLRGQIHNLRSLIVISHPQMSIFQIIRLEREQATRAVECAETRRAGVKSS